MSNDILVLRSKIRLSDFDSRKLQNDILSQMETGVILLPDYVEVVRIPDGEVGCELVVMDGGEYKAVKWVIRNTEGLYFKSFGYKPGTSPTWADSKKDAFKYDTRKEAEDIKAYLYASYGCHLLKVEDICEEVAPKRYLLKCYDGRYLYRYTPGSSIIELTPDKTFAISFSKSRAEEMLKKVGRAYELEEL